jgi:hypothetical protein
MVSGSTTRRNAQLAVRLSAAEAAALERAARADERPASTMARKIILGWLRENGLLDEVKTGR